MDKMAYAWIAVFIIFGAIEAVTPQLTTIWFAVGGLLAFFASLLGVPLWGQLLVFTLSSAALIAFTRPMAKRLLSGATKTNVDAVIGAQAIVTADIDNDQNTGLARVNGQIWSTRSEDGRKIEAGTKVIVTAVAGVKLIVK